jgi:septal ring factor EnvC (AmiA/AmiB activator)
MQITANEVSDVGSEREYNDRISKVKDNIGKKTNDVASDFTKMHKLKSEAIKTTEDMLKDANNDLAKMEKKINVDKDLAPESRERLDKEIAVAREVLQAKYEAINQCLSDVDIPVFNPITANKAKSFNDIRIQARR